MASKRPAAKPKGKPAKRAKGAPPKEPAGAPPAKSRLPKMRLPSLKGRFARKPKEPKPPKPVKVKATKPTAPPPPSARHAVLVEEHDDHVPAPERPRGVLLRWRKTRNPSGQARMSQALAAALARAGVDV